MNNLERRYRRLLKVLPGWYRQDREEEMVGIFLAERTDALDLEHSWPGWGELWATLGLAVRTHLAAGAALVHVPDRARWRGEVVRALGMLGLLLGVFYAGAALTSAALSHGDPLWGSSVTWLRVFDAAPVAAFVALLAGRRTPAKLLAALGFVPTVLALATPGPLVYWAAFQLPSVVLFVALCLGFHREAPTPPASRQAWWGGGAALLGVVGGFTTGYGLLVVVAAVAVVRVVAFVRGDVVLGRALSLFAVLLLVPVLAFTQVAFLVRQDVPFGLAVAMAAVLVAVVASPVRRRAARGAVNPVAG
ncbi:hypothetical protein BBK82_37095 [Lentzea guizhouensis]|uniref:Uncharacterized protein n=1 Tax=Lentzea guizhouensis TaxID=1586287 RepID=A0A1B2HSS3_9PSEU|nr:hypothetical protein [Lentzea guizhouensis]ANZ40777.1 hypothetical protein BBK82_37095 [Lentzea guizhouensis]